MLYNHHQRALHEAGLKLNDMRLMIRSSVPTWDLKVDERQAREIMYEIRASHVKHAAEQIVQRFTIEQYDTDITGETVITSSCIVVSLADFGRLVDNEVAYRMSRMRSIMPGVVVGS